jgi:two-component system sensor histidine kinase MprB
VSLAGVVGATLVGRVIARSALRPVDDLTAAAENVAQVLAGSVLAGAGALAVLTLR